MSESPHDGPRGKWQFSLFALMAAVTAFAVLLSTMKSVPSELWVGVGMVVAVAIGIGSVLYEIYKKAANLTGRVGASIAISTIRMGHAVPCERLKQVQCIFRTQEMAHQHQEEGGEVRAVGFSHVLAVVAVGQNMGNFVQDDELAPARLRYFDFGQKVMGGGLPLPVFSYDRDWTQHTAAELPLQPSAAEDFVHEGLHLANRRERVSQDRSHFIFGLIESPALGISGGGFCDEAHRVSRTTFP